ncbi:LuxR C-terminal-related transcriptional regulator [Inquilinus limosus]|uniref:LuxR C-terminal-related transcriptional regulator n=1 Tax=Inquilinus limosus TaxID=171674 RepID=UPI001B7FED23|nr:response regulator transcription factor [Inquilinus limosus]
MVRIHQNSETTRTSRTQNKKSTYNKKDETAEKLQRLTKLAGIIMIAYKATPFDAIDDTTSGEMASAQPAHGIDHPVDAAAAVSSPPSDARTPLIAIIDPRTLGRDSLARALEATECRFRNHCFARLDEWLQDGPVREGTAAILLGIGAMDADDEGLAADLQLLAREFGHIPTIVIGDIEDPSHVLRILGHGARGYIPTSVSLSVAVEAISLARAGGLFVPAGSLMQVQRLSSEPPQGVAPLETLLTERQAAVAEAVARGKANKIIAYELNLCESTVKVHIRSIMKKLQARNRTEVAYKLHNLTQSRPGSTRGWSSAGSPARLQGWR